MNVGGPTARAAAGTVLAITFVASSVAGTGDRFWPIAPAGMFAFATNEVVELQLHGHRADGTAVWLDPAAFGLTGTELTMQLRGASGGRVSFDDEHLVLELARWWNERRPEDVVVEVEVVLHRVFLDRPDHHLDATMLVVPIDPVPAGPAPGAP